MKLMTQEEWDLFRRQIEVQIEEYYAAVMAALAWWNGRKQRKSGFRCKRAGDGDG